MITSPLPDATRANWVDRFAPEGLKPWLKLGRFDRPIGIWLLLLPGWQGIALALAQSCTAPDGYGWWLAAAFAVGACLMRAAGCAFNDVVDRDIDRQVARTAARPVASGRISVNGAWAFVICCSLISLLILLTFNLTAILLGVGSLALVAAYPFMKRITWWPQAWLGLTFNWGALMGYAALGGQVPPAVLLLYLGGVFWTLGYDTLYALQDLEDDAMVGVKSSARRLGGRVKTGVAVFYGLAVLCAAGAGVLAGLGPLFALGLLAYAGHLALQVMRVKPDDGALALRLFRSNREAGLILLAAVALGAIPL
ncbi:4-hydroxybenzoate octaprenyltransferase [Brevundimonas sp.]|uniref:4-hydroxybenzoate octaprenyltransferase n=1 Tax=Brevundimonas sp. TaxID=1871086 RepID=UPI00391DC29C